MPKGSPKPQLERQIHLPLARAFVISMKSIKMRLGRSIITAAGIFLGIAFLVSVLAQGLVQWPMPPDKEKIRPGFARLDGEFETPGDRSVWNPIGKDEAIAAGIPKGIVDRMAGTAESFSLTDLVTQINAMKKTETDLPAAKAVVDGYSKLPKAMMTKADTEILDASEIEKGGLPSTEVNAITTAGTITVVALKAARDKASASLAALEKTQKDLSEFGTVPQAAIDRLSAEKAITVADLLKQAKPTAGADLSKVMIVNHGRKLMLDLAKDPAAGEAKMRSGDGVLILDAASGNRSIWLAIMALLVCTIGITNSMLMSVTERFREIGTMKCLGALDRFVVELFIFESGFLGVIASAAGAIVGVLAILVLAIFDKGFGILGQVAVLDLFKIFFSGIGVGCLVTMIATIAPAIRAAQMPPAAALRSEV